MTSGGATPTPTPASRTLAGGSAAGARLRSALFRRLRGVVGEGMEPAAAARLAPRKILVIQLQQIGDTIVFTPALRAIRERFPDAEIHALVNRASEQVLRWSPHVDRLIVDRRWKSGKSGGGRRPSLDTVRRLRGERYDLAITCVNEQAFAYTLLAWSSGARHRIGFDTEGRGALHTIRLAVPPETSMEECNIALARALGAPDGDWHTEMHFGAGDAAHAEALLHDVPGDAAAPLAVIHPAANWQSKTWYAERWATVADWLVEQGGARVAFVGTAAEGAEIEAIRGLMRARAASLAGRADLPQLAALLTRARLFVGTDSGPRHVAGAVRVPSVTVMSSQDFPWRWPSRDPEAVVLRSDPSCSPCFLAYCSHRTCMARIGAAEVIAACARLLGVRREPLSGALARTGGA